MKGLGARAASGLVWSAVESWGSQLLGVVLFVVLARLIAPEAFGLLAMAAVFIALVQTLVDQGLSAAVVQREDLQDDHLHVAFWTAVATGAVLAGAGLALAGPIAAFFGEPRLVPVVRWLSATVLLASLGTTQAALLRRALAFRALAVRSIAAAVAGGALGILLAVRGHGVMALVAQQVCAAAVGTALLWFASDWRPRPRFPVARLREILPFGSRVVGTNVLDFLNRHADDFFIGVYLGATALGFYSVAYRLLVSATAVLTGFSSAVAFPTFSRLQREPERLRSALLMATHATALVSLPVFIGMALLAPEIVEVVFGREWMAAAAVMRILAFIGILHSVSYFTNNVFHATGRAETVLWLSALNAVTNVLAFWIAARFGLVTVSAVYVVRGYLVAPVRLRLLKRHLGVDARSYLATLGAPALACGVMAVAVLGTLSLPGLGPHARLGLGTGVGAAVYLAVVWSLDRTRIRELAALARGALRPGSARARPSGAAAEL